MTAFRCMQKLAHKSVGLMLIIVSLSACNDHSKANPPPAVDDDSNEKPTATLSFNDQLGSKETVLVTFSEPMDINSLQLGGSLANAASSEWQDELQLSLRPGTYWPPGQQTLSVDASDSEGLAMDTLHADVDVVLSFQTGQKAAVVIGQQNFTNGDSRQDPDALSAGANTLDLPSSAVEYSREHNILFIPDTFDSRVLGFFGIPEHNNANADFVVGQDSFTSSTGETSQTKSRRPQGLSAQGGKLLVGDPDSHRVLIYSPIPQSGPGEATAVLGQSSFETFDNGCGPHQLNHSHKQFVTPSGRLLVADGVNNRVLVWNEIPDETGVAPDMVIGQPDFETCTAQPSSARTLQHPTGIWSDDERLVIVDNYNNRVLIWNTFPEQNLAPADVVLGQADMQSIAANDDDQDGTPDPRASARVMDYPWSVWVEHEQLFVADENNHRVLIWHDWPQESFTPADAVIGQPDFAANAANRGKETPTADSLNGPKGVRVVDDKLLVTDTRNSRLLVFPAE